MQTTMEVEGIEMPLSEFRMLTQSELGSTGGISPELLSAVNKVSVKAIEAGYLNFRDFLKYVASEIGDALTAKLRPHFRDGWNRVRDS